jgi:hypothetical protein
MTGRLGIVIGVAALSAVLGAMSPAPPGAPAAVPDIKIRPVVAAGQVLASFAAPEALDPDSRELVKSGVPLTLAYLVELRRPSTVWLDRTIGLSTVAAKVKFDSLASVFQVTKEQDGHTMWSKSTAKEDEMRDWVTAFDSVPIRPFEPLEANADYYVRVRLDAHPRLKFSFWPFGRSNAMGRADFTFIR